MCLVEAFVLVVTRRTLYMEDLLEKRTGLLVGVKDRRKMLAMAEKYEWKTWFRWRKERF